MEGRTADILRQQEQADSTADSTGTDLLVCAATEAELEVYRDAEFGRDALFVTGVGIPAALGRLIPYLQRVRPRRILNIGIAGAYPGSGLRIGDIVLASAEVYGDVGFELPGAPGFRSITDSPFAGDLYAAPLPLERFPEFSDPPEGFWLQTAVGCTVNACTGTETTGRLRERLFGAGFETMEGAAVAQAGRDARIPVCEIRAISNIAARRAMTPENIDRALERLAAYLRACRARHRKL